MLITKELIANLKPCQVRFDNYRAHYAGFIGTLAEFLALDKITYDDKVWVAQRVLSLPVLQRWAALCAESVLYIYEAAYPDDNRPRKTVEAALAGTMTQEIIGAAYAVADAVFAATRAASLVARAAARAADVAATTGAYAREITAGATNLTIYASVNQKIQARLNLELLLKAYEETK